MSLLIGDETQALLSQWVADTSTEVDSEILRSIEPEALSAVPRDRREFHLGSFIRNDECGCDHFRDAMSDELVRDIAQLIQCGDAAEIGPYLIRRLLADKGMQKAMQAEREAAEAQIELALHDEAWANAPSWWRSHDVETGIAVAGEI